LPEEDAMSGPSLLEAHAVTIEAPGGRALVRELSLCLGREQVALVGRNGVGKSTLLEVLAGQRAAARGRVVRRGHLLVVPQHLGGEAASPGEHRRRALEAALEARPDLLVLDEPTSDLDAAGIAWLVGRLARWRDGLLVVSHDRSVLRAFSRFFVVAEGGCRYIEGTFEHLLAELSREREQSERRYLGALNRLVASEEHNATVRRRRQRKKNLGRIRELKRCPARIELNDKRSYKQESQGMRAVLQRQRISAARDGARAGRRALPVDLPLELAPPRLPEGAPAPVISCQAVAAAAGTRTLFSALSLELGRERLAVCGPNGSGKTTLLEVALGLRRPGAGRARCDTARVGYIAQNAANWRADESLAELVAAQLGTVSPEMVARVLRAHRFPLALAGRPLATLSPGERVRAALVCITRREPAPELLVLDEPTQHLDFVGLSALEGALAAWPGGLLVVSHDAEFLAAVGVSRRLELGASAPGDRKEPADGHAGEDQHLDRGR
jgi:ATPase subunit of ABC transporter with duplicated ATPase domains